VKAIRLPGRGRYRRYAPEHAGRHGTACDVSHQDDGHAVDLARRQQSRATLFDLADAAPRTRALQTRWPGRIDDHQPGASSSDMGRMMRSSDTSETTYRLDWANPRRSARILIW